MGQNLYIANQQYGGFINQDPTSISAANATSQELTSDWISVEGQAAITIQCWATTASDQQTWLAYAFYSSANMSTKLANRVAKYGTAGDDYLAYVNVSVPSGAKYLRVSYRRFADGRCMVEYGSTASAYSVAPEDLGDDGELSKIKDPCTKNDLIHEVNGNHTRSVEYIRGTWGAATGAWTGMSQDTELYDGKQIILYMPYAGSGNATLNLTLADGTQTGAKNVYFESTTRFTTHKGQNTQLPLIYHKAQRLSDGNVYEGWWYLANRDTNDTAFFLKYNYSNFISATVMYRYQLMLQQDETTLIPLTTYNNAPSTTTKELTTKEFDPFGLIAYYNSTTTVNANTAIATSAIMFQYAFDLRYCSNVGQTLTAQKDIYLVAVPQSNGKAKLHTTPFVQDLPTTDDGLLYIYLGRAYNTYQIVLAYRHPIYMYRNGALRLYTGYQSLIEGADNSKTDSTPYTFRAVRDSADEIIGNRAYDEIVGASVGWNQLSREVASQASANGIIISASADNGVVTVSGTRNGSGWVSPSAWEISYIAGHKMLFLANSLKVGASHTSSATVNVLEGYTGRANLGANGYYIHSGASNATMRISIGGSIGDVFDFTFIPQVCDLTLALGSTIAEYVLTLETGTAGAGVAWLKSHFPKMFGQYQPYDAGSIKSVTGLSAHVMTGFNQWDEQWEVGSLTSSGGEYASTTRIRAKNYIEALPNTVYYANTAGEMMDIHFYDANQNHIGGTFYEQKTDNVFTTLDGTAYIRFCMSAAYGTTYKNDICINLHWDGSRNGEYEAYKEWTYPLDSTKTFRGIFKLDESNNLYAEGDEYKADGTVARNYAEHQIVPANLANNGHVDDTSIYKVFYHRPDGAYTLNTICDRFVNGVGNIAWNFVARTNSDGIEFQIPYSAIGVTSETTDANKLVAAKTWFTNNPTKLVYELATPTTETAEPYTSPQVVDEYGTEEYVSTSIVPVGHNTLYFSNNQEKLNSLPTPATEDGRYVIQQENGQMILEDADDLYMSKDGVVDVAHGGTGLTASPSMLTNLGSTTAANVLQASPRPGVTGTLGAANGGTGQTSLESSANALINSLPTSAMTPVDNDYYISQYVNGGTTTKVYHRKPLIALWEYIRGKFNSVEMLSTNPFAPPSLKGAYISKIDNAFFAADKRWNVTVNGFASGFSNVSNVFDGNYETSMRVNAGETGTITIDFSTESNGYFPGYPYGNIIISFYYVAIPESVSGRVYCNYASQGVGWHDITFTKVSDSSVGATAYKGYNGYYNISKIEISIVGDGDNSYGVTQVSQIEMHLDRPAPSLTPFLSKYSAQRLYYDLYAPKFIGELVGNATSSTSAGKLTTDAGSGLNPVYFSNGVPVASKGNSIPFVVGTGSTAGTWLGTLDGVTAYYDGLLILYKPSVAGASTTTLNLNNLGAKTCYANNTTKLTTHFPVNQPILLVYSSSQNSGCWMCIDDYWGGNTIPQAQCETAAATAAKVASMTNYSTANTKSHLMLNLRYTNTSATALTLNINSQGAKPVYINGSASSTTNYTLPAGSYLVYYDGTNYYFRTDGKMTGSITGDAATVGGHTVAKDVPSDAKFTDTTYTGTSPISVSGTAISHANSGVTAASKGDTTAQTPGFGSTFKVTSGTVNATGHMTAFADHTVKIPDTEASTSNKGLMTASQVTSLEDVEGKVAQLENYTIDGVYLSDTIFADANVIHYGDASLESGYIVVDCAGLDLLTGARLIAKFTENVSLLNARMKVNGSADKRVLYQGDFASGRTLKVNGAYEFVYDGTDWNLIGELGSGGEENQNAFSYVKVGSTTIAAESKTDTLELVAGDNITLTPDATNDKVTISTGTSMCWYATSSTAAGTAAKTATCSGYAIGSAGHIVNVSFSTANTVAGALTLNVNSKGAKTIYVNGAATSASNCLLWNAGEILTFVYNGQNYMCIGQSGASVQEQNPAFTTPTVYQSRCTIVSGGYFREGKHVYVNVRVKIASSYAGQAAGNLLSGFPTQLGGAVALASYETGTANTVVVGFVSDGYLAFRVKSGSATTSSTEIVFSGTYIAA